ncbi:MAG TPA: VOC family protein [Actinotalea sp.]|jgi:catechol 2,3-dioxygenase-like lactoylglutathione lyase family enzyme
MLSAFPAMPVLAVTDLDRARTFYEGTLGLSSAGPTIEGVIYDAGGVRLLVYPSSYAGTNKATAMSFDVPWDSFAAEVENLRLKGVQFQTFDMEGLTWNDGVAEGDGMRSVWFADPDGNVLNVEAHTEAGVQQ